MGFRKPLLILACAVLAAVSASPSAAGPAPFTPEAFAEAQAAHRLIVIHVNAFWCATCGVQRPVLADILDEVAQSPELGNPVIFTVDFDSQKDVVKRFNVQTQATLIVFNGRTEMGRLTGETDPGAIKALLIEAKTGTPRQVQAAIAEARMLTLASYFLGALAGLLSILSPCVLPLIPIVVGDAAAAHRFGALALSSGVAVSYVAIGLFVATAGLSLGLNADAFRTGAAVLMVLSGIMLWSETWERRFALAGGRFGAAADRLIARLSLSGIVGQFLLGVLLGAVWSPCIGPTLAAAITLAAQHQALGQAALVMLAFGLGVAIPLALIGMASRQAFVRWRGRMHEAGHAGKLVLGFLLVAVGGSILGGIDSDMKIFLLRISPPWLTDVTIRF